MKEYNRNEWQGKRQDQYEFSARVLWYSTLVIFIVATIATLSNF
jgi:hypothetical protein